MCIDRAATKSDCSLVVAMMVMNLSVAQHILDFAESQMRLSGPRVWQLGLSVRLWGAPPVELAAAVALAFHKARKN